MDTLTMLFSSNEGLMLVLCIVIIIAGFKVTDKKSKNKGTKNVQQSSEQQSESQ